MGATAVLMKENRRSALAAAGTLGGADCARGRDFEKTAAIAETAVVASNADQAALMPLIRADVRWREAYRDGDGAIFVRR